MNRVSMVLACAAMLFAVHPAAATEDVSSELAEMRELVQGLKQKVDAQEEQLEHQGQLLEQAQDMARQQQEEDARSGLSSFLDMIEVGGHIAASYNYNLNTPKRPQEPDNGPFDVLESGGFGSNSGEEGNFLLFHQDHNTMTVDQVVFNISKPATEESRAGFGFEVLFGQNANFLGQGGQRNNNDDIQSHRTHNLDGTTDLYISQAYLEYQCGCLGPEITFTAGKFMTLTGAEVFQSPANFNITRGNVYTLLQPVDHLGLTATTDLGPVEFTAGIVNAGNSTISSPDINDEKSYIGSLYVGDDRLNVRSTFIYGAEFVAGTDLDDYDDGGATPNSLRQGLVDVTAWFNPSENLSLWANFNHVFVEGSSLYANGVAVAGRLAVLESTGVSIRGEYIRLHDAADNDINHGEIDIESFEDNQEIYSLTGTVDHSLTDHLMARGEVRFDWIDSPGNAGRGFLENRDGFADNQTVALVELVYTF